MLGFFLFLFLFLFFTIIIKDDLHLLVWRESSRNNLRRMTNMISWLFSTEKTLHIIFNLVLILLEWWVLHAFRSTCFLISICMGLACLDDQALTGNIQVFQFVWSLSRSWVSLLGSPTVMLPVISRRKQHVRSNMWTSSSISHTHKAARCLEPALLTGCCCQLCFALLDTEITQERKEPFYQT
jgi:hypothetical protein